MIFDGKQEEVVLIQFIKNHILANAVRIFSLKR